MIGQVVYFLLFFYLLFLPPRRRIRILCTVCIWHLYLSVLYLAHHKHTDKVLDWFRCVMVIIITAAAVDVLLSLSPIGILLSAH